MTADLTTTPTAPPARDAGPFSRRFYLTVTVLAILILIFGALLMFWDIPGSFSFAMRRRSVTLAAIILTAISGGICTIIFHTITSNRILTPSLMGLESLLVLVQTLLVFTLGVAGLAVFTGVTNFFLELLLMMVFAVALLTLLTRPGRPLHAFLLIGVVVGIFFRSLTVFMQRLISPNEFDALIAKQFGSLTSVPLATMPWAAALVLLVVAVAWRQRRVLDVMALGRDVAMNLGINFRAQVIFGLVLVALMVSVSVAMVGPMLFYGFLVATITYRISDVDDHRHHFILATLVGLALLLGGQVILNEFFAKAALPIVLDLIGGSLFLFILLRRKTLR